MGKDFITIFIFALTALPLQAQKKGVILNMETGIPLRDVKIYTNNGQVVKTDYMGAYHIPQPFKSITIVKPNFVSLTVNSYELGDTTELLPRMNSLNEVIVWGNRRRTTLNVQRAMKDNKNYYTPQPGFNIDLFSIFTSRKGLNKKQRRKHNEIIQNY